MDFFQEQDIARKRTRRLVLLMAAAVGVIILLTYLVFSVAIHVFFQPPVEGGEIASVDVGSLFRLDLLLFVGMAVGLVVGGSILLKMMELREGGRVIAEMLGGRRLEPGTSDPAERRILNVVEEMAIASGMAVPPVYLMDREAGINAFAAGYSPDDAVIGVTRGCVEMLSRDELQGVMAHEFSHILNGDMRLNIRLISVVYGILAIGLFGSMLLRMALYSSVARSRNDKGNAALPLLAIGVALLIIGSVGTFFGNLIKAAVSRQREYLADAAAVQFTRNPEGIGGALMKIGGHASHGQLSNTHADEISHMYFAEGVGHWLGSLMATHPGLPVRIRRVLPDWNGVFPPVTPSVWHREHGEQKARQAQKNREIDRQKLGRRAMTGVVLGGAMAQSLAQAQQAAAQVGQPSPAHLEQARILRDAIAPPLVDAAREPYGARAVIYALIMHGDADVRRRQLERLAGHGDPAVYKLVGQLLAHVDVLPAAARLPLIDLAMPALRELSPKQYRTFRENIDHLIKADDQVSLSEWMIHTVMLRHLDPTFSGPRRVAVQYYSLKPVTQPLSVLLSTLAWGSGQQQEAAQECFEAAAPLLEVEGVDFLPVASCGLKPLGPALNTLEQTSPREKRKIITACAVCIAHNQRVSVEEAELLRIVADRLDCPMPPLLPDAV